MLLKKNLQFLIDNATTLQDTLGVNFLDPGLQMDLLVRVGYNRRHLHRKLTGTEQEQKWKSLVADSNVDHQNLDQLNRVAVVMEARRMQRKYADGSLKLAGHLRMLSTSEIQAKDASGQRCQCDPFYKLHHDAEKQENVSRLQWILSDNPSEQLLTKRSKKWKDKDQLRLPRNSQAACP